MKMRKAIICFIFSALAAALVFAGCTAIEAPPAEIVETPVSSSAHETTPDTAPPPTAAQTPEPVTETCQPEAAQPVGEEKPGGFTADEALYRRAEELSRRFEVDIRIADQCSPDYPHFNAYAVADTAFVTAGLDILEAALSAYPEGFFLQLRYGGIQSIRFELVGGLCARSDSKYGEYFGSYTGFAQEEADHYLVVLDIYMMSEKTVYHELAHVIDAKLAWDAELRPEALFSEESWLALQPEGFEYAFTYGVLPQETMDFALSGYFVEEYSCRYPTEDRATMMEEAMAENTYVFEHKPYLRDKLRYYSECIRDCFDTTGWPELVAWEGFLQH